MRLADVHTRGPVITGKIQAGIMLGGCCTAKLLGGEHLLRRSLVVGPRCISPLQGLVETKRRERLVWFLIGQIKFLTRRQADGAGESQLLLGVVVTSNDELLLPSLQFDLRAKGINGR